jgi:hypothetical protein
MSASRRSVSSPPSVGRSPLASRDDALDLVGMLVDSPLQPQTVALTFDAHDQPLVCLTIDGTRRSLGTLTDDLVTLFSTWEMCRTVVLATTSTGRAKMPDAGEQVAFLDARERFELEGITLVDWFIIGERRGWSLAELTDARSLWRGFRADE